MLAVILAPHGFRIALANEATLSRGLRTIELLQSHAAVGYEWQNTRLGPGCTGPTATCTTSCRSFTSVFRPGTCLMCCGLTSTMLLPSSRMLNTGRQYTPVLSRAISLMSRLVNQSLNEIALESTGVYW